MQSNEGILGFSADVHVQPTLSIVPGLKNITRIVCGANHCLALDNKGTVVAWGSGQQNQLGRRVIERTRLNGLIPREFGLPKNKVCSSLLSSLAFLVHTLIAFLKQISFIAAGSYHSFAIDKTGLVWAWGLNSYGETGCSDDVGEDEAVVLRPTKVASLADKNIVHLSGGSHHSLAITASGEILGFGRCDGAQLGITAFDSLPKESVHRDEKGVARIVAVPTKLPGVGHGGAVFCDSGPDQNLVVTKDGKAYSWGFSVNYQTGQGTTDDVNEVTLVDNTAVRETKLTWAGCGGQFGMFASEA